MIHHHHYHNNNNDNNSKSNNKNNNNKSITRKISGKLWQMTRQEVIVIGLSTITP